MICCQEVTMSKHPLFDVVCCDGRDPTPLGEVLDHLDEVALSIDDFGGSEVADMIAILWLAVDILRGRGYSHEQIWSFVIEPNQLVRWTNE
jgi:hypothetical protein